MLPTFFTNTVTLTPPQTPSTSRTTPPRPPQRQTRLTSPTPPKPRTSRLDASENLSAVLAAATIGLGLAAQLLRFLEVAT